MTPAERFWSRVDKSGDCWTWTGTLTSNGYGSFWDGQRTTRAHRWSYRAAKGRIPEGLYVLHSCDNRRCVNPDHLRAGTHDDNMRDRDERGRTYNGMADLTECPKGHAYDEANTYVDPEGYRHCRACDRTRKQRKRECPECGELYRTLDRHRRRRHAAALAAVKATIGADQ